MQNVNYTEQLKARFAENGGKLFFVDGFKNRAFASVKAILESENSGSSVCVVSNSETAKRVNKVLYGNSGATLITTVDDFRRLCREANIDNRYASESAERFRIKYPNVIVALTSDSDDPVLHAQLRCVEGKVGEYKSCDRDIYTISDYLTDAEYSFAIVDNVYDMVSFKEIDNPHDVDPRNFDYIDIMHRSYITDIGHSYKRLTRLVDSAEKAIVVSNSVIEKNIVSFYAAASLVNNPFSYSKTKKQAKAHTSNYDGDIDTTLEAVSFCENDSSVQSRCIQSSRGRGQLVPGTADRLKKYIADNLRFMTKEEIFLRAFSVVSKGKKGLDNSEIIEFLDDDDILARTVCDMFFNDSLKADIEEVMEREKLVDMSSEHIGQLFEIIKKYAPYCESGKIDSGCSVYRIYHDDSGFEDLIRRSSESFDRNENALSATYFGDDDQFKCIATKNLLLENSLRTPLLIVSKKNPSDIVSSMSKIIDKKVYMLGCDDESISADSIAVMNYTGFEAQARSLNFSSVIFFDILPDLYLFDTLVKKALNMSDNVNGVLLSTYDNIEGLLTDTWQEKWINENDELFAIKNSEIYIRGEATYDYNVVVAELDEIYRSYKHLIDGTSNVNHRSLANRFNNTITQLNLRGASYSEETEEDFGYFAKISSYYSGVFANSVSVGNLGREIIAEKPIVDANGKKKKRHEYESVADGNRVAFNICSKQLHETCDFRNSDCFTCPLYGKSIINNIEVFENSVRGYFKESSRIMSKIQSDRIARALDDTIASAQNSGGGSDLDIERVRNAGKDIDRLLGKLLKSKPTAEIPFYAQYGDIFDIKETVQSIHFDIFKKYYDQFIHIFEKATKEMKKSFGTVGQGAKSSLHTL